MQLDENAKMNTSDQVEPAATMTDEKAMQTLLASGLVTQPATRPFELPKPVVFPPSQDGKTMSDLALELCGSK
ncbi:MAG: hypothetical protein CFE43_05200 [Burkholderiales bacterium PBB3]|nr:MAG: hypothetical protein CFE43_05200 [Burkholderiales bacterium PBB3]